MTTVLCRPQQRLMSLAKAHHSDSKLMSFSTVQDQPDDAPRGLLTSTQMLCDSHGMTLRRGLGRARAVLWAVPSCGHASLASAAGSDQACFVAY